MNRKLTTTETEEAPEHKSTELPPEWLEIDFSELVDLGVHFGRPQLKQWWERKYCSASEAQESILHFTYHLKHSKKEDFRTGPLNFFMGIMAKSHYFPRPEGYLSPAEEALKRRAEDMKRRSESMHKLQEELVNAAAEIWVNSLTRAIIQKLVPQFTIHERDVADHLGISQDTVRRLCTDGKLKPILTRGGHRRFRLNDLQEVEPHSEK